MVTTEPILGVKDVTKSSTWYQTLFNCESAHGGDKFEILKNKTGAVILCLHKWGEHDHPTLRSPDIPTGNGLILYFRVQDLEQTWNNALELNAEIEAKPSHNENSGQKEFAIRDLDGYYLLISK